MLAEPAYTLLALARPTGEPWPDLPWGARALAPEVGGLTLVVSTPPSTIDAAIAAAWVAWIDDRAAERDLLPARMGPPEPIDRLVERVEARAAAWAERLIAARGCGQVEVTPGVEGAGAEPARPLSGAGAQWLAGRRAAHAPALTLERELERWAAHPDVRAVARGTGRVAILARRGPDVWDRLRAGAPLGAVLSRWMAIWAPFSTQLAPKFEPTAEPV